MAAPRGGDGAPPANPPPRPRSRSSIAPRFEPEYIKTVGETIGVTNLTECAQMYLADQMTTLIQRIIYDAGKYTIHGRRTVLSSQDIDYSLADHNIKAFSPLGHCTPSGPSLVHVRNPNGARGEDLFIEEDTTMDLADMSYRKIAKPPIRVKLRTHMLAYNGVVPKIVENIPHASEEEVLAEEECKQSTVAAAIARRRDTAGAKTSDAAGVTFRNAARGVKGREKVYVKPTAVQPLSVEQQLYYKEIIEACVGTEDKRRLDALQSLELDTGVQVLLPHISKLIFRSVRWNLVQRCLSMLIYLMRIVRAVANNKSVTMDYVVSLLLHEIVPSVISCMVGRRLCQRLETDNHWALRDFAAKTLVIILSRQEDKPTFRQRVYRSLRKVFDDPRASYAQVYGTLSTLNEISSHQDRYDMYDRFVDLMNACHPSATGSLNQEMKMEAQRLFNILSKVETKMLASYRRISDNL